MNSSQSVSALSLSPCAKTQQCFCNHSTSLERLTVQISWTMWISFILFFFRKHHTSPFHIKASVSPSQHHCLGPSSCVHAWWWRPMIISVSPSGTQVCGGGPPASVIRHRGQTRAGLERLRHVPREGSTPPLLHPHPSEDSLFTAPDGGWSWVLMNAILHDPQNNSRPENYIWPHLGGGQKS